MEYFANLPDDQLAAELESRISAYYNWILTTGRLARWRIAYDTNYGDRGTHNASFVQAGGKQGELSFLMSNEYRSLVQHLMVFAFQSRTSLETVATNTDPKSKASAYVGKGVMEYFRRDGKIDAHSKMATETSLIMDTGWVFNEWDLTRGEAIQPDPDSGQMIRQGQIKSRYRTPLGVVTDFTKPDGEERDWVMVQDPVNKFDLAAQFPEKADAITGLSRDLTRDALYRFGDVYRFDIGFNSPDIDVWTFYHRKTPACPKGKMFRFANKGIHLGPAIPMPYRKLPGNRICPTEQILSSMGYSNANGLLSLQDCMDAMISAAVTNMTACGVNNIWCEDPASLDFEQLAQGMNLLGGGGAKEPHVLMLNRLPPEWFSLANFIIARMEAISGVNAVARGNTEGKDFSGAAMALLQSMSIQYNNGLVQAVNRLAEDNGNDIIQLTQDFAHEPALGMIIGANNEYMMMEYSSKDLKPIQRVYARQSNPMKDTTAGKLQLLEQYKSIPGVVTSGAQITEIMETGSLDSTTEPGRNLQLAMDKENEALRRGEVPPVVFTDNHPAHYQHHAQVFASPEERKDPELLKRVRAHMDQHDLTWQQTNPAILVALNIPPYPFPPMPMSPDGSPLPPPGGAPVDAAPPSGPPGAPIAPPGPNLPTNPLTGEQWSPESGGVPQGAQ
jgi:hypothetical protein